MHGRHLVRFRALPTMTQRDRDALTRDLRLGVARLEGRPRLAFSPEQLAHGVPLRPSPRTPMSSFAVLPEADDRRPLRQYATP